MDEGGANVSFILELDQVEKHFKDFSLDKISFRLEPGYIMGFIGPNGSGKSTTIKLIMNLIQKDGGSIRLFGKDHNQNEIEVKQQIGFVYEQDYFYENLTIDETKRLVSRFYTSWDENLFQKYRKHFELPADKKVKECSKGMKMKMSLALALAHRPKLILMDEPTSGLDPIVRNELLEILQDVIQDEEKAIFFSTHITTDLDRIADYITFIYQGKIVLAQNKDDLLHTYGIVKGGSNLLDEGSHQHFIGIRENQFGFEGLTKDASYIRQRFGEKVVIEKPTLDDIMLYYIKGGRGK